MPELRSSGQCVSSGQFATDMRLRCEEWPPVRRCVRKNGLGIRVVRCAILIVCFQSALAIADSYTLPSKNFAIPNCRMSMTRSCDLQQDLTLRPITHAHWNSSLRLHAGGEAIQLQISRALWAKIRQESVRRPLVLLPTTVSGAALFGDQSQFSRSDPIENLLMRIVRKLLLSDHPWRKKPTPRCRNHPGAPGCE